MQFIEKYNVPRITFHMAQNFKYSQLTYGDEGKKRPADFFVNFATTDTVDLLVVAFTPG